MAIQLSLLPEIVPNEVCPDSPPLARTSSLAGVYVVQSAAWDGLRPEPFSLALKIGMTYSLEQRLRSYKTHAPAAEFVRIFRAESMAVRILLERRMQTATVRWAIAPHSEWRFDIPIVLETVDRIAHANLGLDAVIESEAHVRRLHASPEWRLHLAKILGDGIPVLPLRQNP